MLCLNTHHSKPPGEDRLIFISIHSNYAFHIPRTTLMSLYSVFVKGFLVANGVYDLLCATCIETGGCGVFSTMHMNVLTSEDWSENALAMYLASLWALTYGSVRLVAGLYRCNGLDVLAIISYVIQAVAFSFPPFVGPTYDRVGVGILSMLCAFGVALRGRAPPVYQPVVSDNSACEEEIMV